MENLHIGKAIPFDYMFNLSFVRIDFIRQFLFGYRLYLAMFKINYIKYKI